MSNMSPQYGRFNGGIWQRLENLGRSWAKEFETVYVTSGAIFDFDAEKGRDRDADVATVQRKRAGPPFEDALADAAREHAVASPETIRRMLASNAARATATRPLDVRQLREATGLGTGSGHVDH